MQVHLVSRHAGALEWLEAMGVQVDMLWTHLNLASLHPGDIVIGALPVHLAAEVCARGAHYQHICIDRPEHLRGVELAMGEMFALGARLEGFSVEPRSTGCGIHRGAVR